MHCFHTHHAPILFLLLCPQNSYETIIQDLIKLNKIRRHGPTASILPVNSVAHFWKKLAFFDAMCSWQVHVSCSFSACPASTCWCLFYSFQIFFFFFETEVKLDGKSALLLLFIWGFHLPFLSPLRSLLSSTSPNQQPTALRLLQKVF